MDDLSSIFQGEFPTCLLFHGLILTKGYIEFQCILICLSFKIIDDVRKGRETLPFLNTAKLTWRIDFWSNNHLRAFLLIMSYLYALFLFDIDLSTFNNVDKKQQFLYFEEIYWWQIALSPCYVNVVNEGNQ